MTTIDQYYDNQAVGLPYFAGPASQQGHGLGGIFSSIFRAVTPLLRSAAPVAKAAARTVAKEAAKTGAAILTDVAQGKRIKNAAKKRSSQAADRLIQRGVKKLRHMNKTAKTIKGRKHRRDVFSP